MKIRLARPLLKRIWRAIIEFEMLEADDRLLVGVSGGKDSAFLLYAMKLLQETAPFSFDLGAVHVDLGFDTSGIDSIEAYCRDLEVPIFVERTQIGALALGDETQNPCAKCAFFRRGSVGGVATRHGFNKVAYAHHNDDVVVTFLMSQLYSGHLNTFLPKTLLQRSGLTLIRPLVYVREKEIRRAIRDIPFTPVPSPCPIDGKTKRSQTKEMVAALTRENPYVYTNLAAALRQGRHVELWPPSLSKEEMRERHQRVMGQARAKSEEKGE